MNAVVPIKRNGKMTKIVARIGGTVSVGFMW